MSLTGQFDPAEHHEDDRWRCEACDASFHVLGVYKTCPACGVRLDADGRPDPLPPVVVAIEIDTRDEASLRTLVAERFRDAKVVGLPASRYRRDTKR